MRLSDTMVKVSLSISQWTGTAREKNGAEAIERDAGAKKGTVSARKKVLPGCAELEAIQKHNNAFRLWFYEQTLPWDDNGGRILPAPNAEPFMRGVAEWKDKGAKLVEAFVNVYPEMYQKSQLSLGTLWEQSAYPDPSVIRSKYGYRFHAEPIGDINDLRNFEGFKPEEVDERVMEAEQAIQERLAAAQKDLWERLFDGVNAMADKLAVPIGAQGSIFRDSLVNNLTELADLLPKMNVVKDPNIDRMVDDVKKKLLGVHPEALRVNPELRAERAAKARELAEQAKAYL